MTDIAARAPLRTRWASGWSVLLWGLAGVLALCQAMIWYGPETPRLAVLEQFALQLGIVALLAAVLALVLRRWARVHPAGRADRDLVLAGLQPSWRGGNRHRTGAAQGRLRQSLALGRGPRPDHRSVAGQRCRHHRPDRGDAGLAPRAGAALRQVSVSDRLLRPRSGMPDHAAVQAADRAADGRSRLEGDADRRRRRASGGTAGRSRCWRRTGSARCCAATPARGAPTMPSVPPTWPKDCR